MFMQDIAHIKGSTNSKLQQYELVPFKCNQVNKKCPKIVVGSRILNRVNDSNRVEIQTVNIQMQFLLRS